MFHNVLPIHVATETRSEEANRPPLFANSNYSSSSGVISRNSTTSASSPFFLERFASSYDRTGKNQSENSWDDVVPVRPHRKDNQQNILPSNLHHYHTISNGSFSQTSTLRDNRSPSKQNILHPGGDPSNDAYSTTTPLPIVASKQASNELYSHDRCRDTTLTVDSDWDNYRILKSLTYYFPSTGANRSNRSSRISRVASGLITKSSKSAKSRPRSRPQSKPLPIPDHRYFTRQDNQTLYSPSSPPCFSQPTYRRPLPVPSTLASLLQTENNSAVTNLTDNDNTSPDSRRARKTFPKPRNVRNIKKAGAKYWGEELPYPKMVPPPAGPAGMSPYESRSPPKKTTEGLYSIPQFDALYDSGVYGGQDSRYNSRTKPEGSNLQDILPPAKSLRSSSVYASSTGVPYDRPESEAPAVPVNDYRQYLAKMLDSNLSVRKAGTLPQAGEDHGTTTSNRALDYSTGPPRVELNLDRMKTSENWLAAATFPPTEPPQDARRERMNFTIAAQDESYRDQIDNGSVPSGYPTRNPTKTNIDDGKIPNLRALKPESLYLPNNEFDYSQSPAYDKIPARQNKNITVLPVVANTNPDPNLSFFSQDFSRNDELYMNNPGSPSASDGDPWSAGSGFPAGFERVMPPKHQNDQSPNNKKQMPGVIPVGIGLPKSPAERFSWFSNGGTLEQHQPEIMTSPQNVTTGRAPYDYTSPSEPTQHMAYNRDLRAPNPPFAGSQNPNAASMESVDMFSPNRVRDAGLVGAGLAGVGVAAYTLTDDSRTGEKGNNRGDTYPKEMEQGPPLSNGVEAPFHSYGNAAVSSAIIIPTTTPGREIAAGRFGDRVGDGGVTERRHSGGGGGDGNWLTKRLKNKKNRKPIVICVGLMIIILVIVAIVLGVVLSKKSSTDDDSKDTGIQWVNLTGYPSIPVSVLTVGRAVLQSSRNGCVNPTTMWSCAMTKEEQLDEPSNGPTEPNFRFQIKFDNSSELVSTASSKSSRLRRSTGGSGDNRFGEFGRPEESIWTWIQKRSDPAFIPSPAQPSEEDRTFLGATTDNVTTPFQGENTPFFITFLNPDTDFTTSSNAKRRRSEPEVDLSVQHVERAGSNVVTEPTTAEGLEKRATITVTVAAGNTAAINSFTGSKVTVTRTATVQTVASNGQGTTVVGVPITTTISSTATSTDAAASLDLSGAIPAPSVLPNGTAAPANLLALPTSQPLLLFNRGQSDEHYGFYTYYDRSIFLKSVQIVNTNNPGAGSVAADQNGGSTLDGANTRCTWAQTRFLVQIWTKGSGTLLSQTAQTTTNSKSSADSRANDFSQPGSFPYPVTVRIDRHGGDPTNKMIYLYGLDVDSRIQSNSSRIQVENRSFGGTDVNPSKGAFGTTVISTADGGPGGMDGGSGGCFCEWTNWS